MWTEGGEGVLRKFKGKEGVRKERGRRGNNQRGEKKWE